MWRHAERFARGLAAARPASLARWAALLGTALALPPAREVLEARMTLHMLVQLPLIALGGALLGAAWLRAGAGSSAGRILRVLQFGNRGGATGIIGASFVMLLWMLPRLLDAARLEPATDALKFVTVACAGLAVAVSWPQLPAIARAVVHLEVVATLLRFGWGYLAAEERLCLVYLAGDQQRTGALLLWLGAAYAVAVVWRPLFGGQHGDAPHLAPRKVPENA